MTLEENETMQRGAEELLRGLGEGPRVPDEARLRLGNRLRVNPLIDHPPSHLEARAPMGLGGRAYKMVGTGLAGRGAVYLLAIGATAALVGGWVLQRTSGVSLRPTSESIPAAPAAPVGVPPVEGVERSAPDAPAASPSAPTVEGNARGGADRRLIGERGAARSEAPREHSLGAERRLLDAARAALVEGDVGRASARLAEHARRFARGALAEERAALTIDSLVARGRYVEARRHAITFREKYPASLFSGSVDAAIESIPMTDHSPSLQ
jgi:hypothetical protein